MFQVGDNVRTHPWGVWGIDFLNRIQVSDCLMHHVYQRGTLNCGLIENFIESAVDILTRKHTTVGRWGLRSTRFVFYNLPMDL